MRLFPPDGLDGLAQRELQQKNDWTTVRTPLYRLQTTGNVGVWHLAEISLLANDRRQ
jgi:hypothetical protein